jgi:hypothetical protein
VTIPRLLTAVLLCGLGCLLAAGAAWRPAGPVASVAAAARPADADRVAPLAVLAAWDRERSAAWRRGDPAALRRLYVARSRAGRADRALLAAYAGRGLRVAGLRMQRAAVEVLAADAERVVLVVTDRVVGASVVGPRGRVALPDDGWSRRRVVLSRLGGRWQVVEVREISAAQSPAPT